MAITVGRVLDTEDWHCPLGPLCVWKRTEMEIVELPLPSAWIASAGGIG